MWKPEHRCAAERHGLRYPSDLTEAEWAMIAPRIPPAKRGGRPRNVDVREVLNAIFYVLWTGCQWKALPKDRAGPGCLDSAPRDLSGFLPGYAERGALRFCRCVGRA